MSVWHAYRDALTVLQLTQQFVLVVQLVIIKMMINAVHVKDSAQNANPKRNAQLALLDIS